jgi:hypothetical protein
MGATGGASPVALGRAIDPPNRAFTRLRTPGTWSAASPHSGRIVGYTE